MQLEQYTTPITKPNTDLAIVVAVVKEEHLEEAAATFGSFEAGRFEILRLLAHSDRLIEATKFLIIFEVVGLTS